MIVINDPTSSQGLLSTENWKERRERKISSPLSVYRKENKVGKCSNLDKIENHCGNKVECILVARENGGVFPSNFVRSGRMDLLDFFKNILEFRGSSENLPVE